MKKLRAREGHTVRIPKNLFLRVVRLADKEGRTLFSQTLRIVQKGLEGSGG